MTAIYDWPSEHRGMTAGRFYLRAANLQSVGSFTGEVTPYGPIVQRFFCEFTPPPKSNENARTISGIISRARGISGLFRIYDTARKEPYYNSEVTKTTENWDDDTTFSDGTAWESGPLPNYVSVESNASRGDNSIIMQGFAANLTKVLRLGDLFELRPNGQPMEFGHLYEVTVDANTDANGKTRVYFEPGLRAGVAAGDQIVLKNPTSVFRLISDEQGPIEWDRSLVGRVGLSFAEVLPRT